MAWTTTQLGFLGSTSVHDLTTLGGLIAPVFAGTRRRLSRHRGGLHDKLKMLGVALRCQFASARASSLRHQHFRASCVSVRPPTRATRRAEMRRLFIVNSTAARRQAVAEARRAEAFGRLHVRRS